MGSECMDTDLNNRPLLNTLRFEENRLRTFATWPVQAPIQAERLAKAGFYYQGQNLEVACFSCGGRISHWNYGDIVISIHSTLFPNCKFVKNQSDNVPMFTSVDESMMRNINTPSIVNRPTNNRRSSISSSNESNYSEVFEGGPFNSESEMNIDPLETRPASQPPRSNIIAIPQHLKVENERLRTFGNKWPHDYISPVDLAKAGFFYLQIGDKVQCVFCHGVLTSWERGDLPYTEHVNNFPLCPFVMGRDVGNVPNGTGDTCGRPIPMNQNGGLRRMPNSVPEQHRPIPMILNNTRELEDIGINMHKGPEHPAQASKDARLRSFLSWPEHAAVGPEQLAEAGFFYIGINDHAKCFYCDGGLCNWEPNDNPWVEHARWFPNCGYVKLNKGGGFIKNSQESAKKALEDCHHTTTINGVLTPCGTPMRPSDVAGPSQQGPSELTGGSLPTVKAQTCEQSKVSPLDQQLDTEMQSNMVKAFLRTTGNSYPPHLVRYAILRKLQETGSGVRNIDQLCEAIQKVKSEEARKIRTALTQGNDRRVSNGDVKTASGLSAPSANLQPSSPSSNVSLEEENRQLREQRMCKICMDQEVGVVFLPCGHLIACVQCAPALKDCAFCRQPIKGTIRTFLS